MNCLARTADTFYSFFVALFAVGRKVFKEVSRHVRRAPTCGLQDHVHPNFGLLCWSLQKSKREETQVSATLDTDLLFLLEATFCIFKI